MTTKSYITPANDGTWTVTIKVTFADGKICKVKRRHLASVEDARAAVADFAKQ